MAAPPVVVGKLVHGTNSGDGRVLVINERASASVNRVDVHSIDAGENFSRGDAATVCEKMAADFLTR